MLVERYEKNPILKPKNIHSWEAKAVFNGCPIEKDGKIYLVYRALSLPHYILPSNPSFRIEVSNIGVAVSKNGLDFHDREILIPPSEKWDCCGCEDPSIVKIDDKYLIFYTALSNFPPSADDIKVGVAISRDLKTIEEKHLVTHFDSKQFVLFPEKINGKFWGMLSVHTDKPPAYICLASFDNLDDIWNREYWKEWYEQLEKHSIKLERNPRDLAEVGAPPIKTKYGWLVFYSYIKDYFAHNPLFTIEAVLLDLKDPRKIIARTNYPLLTPEEYYEKIGIVPNVVFTKGALVRKNKIYLYNGAADTVICVAFIDLKELLETMLKRDEIKKIGFIRINKNPIITPNPKNEWESKATFNPGAIYLDNKVHIIYRAMSNDNTSVFGYAISEDGININYRSPEPIYVPREEFEMKKVPNANSGCEDPRLTLIDDRIYMCYTAYDGLNPPRVALTSISLDDFLNQNWKWKKPVLISPPGVDDKDACIFPEKVLDPGTDEMRYLIIHRIGNDISSDLVKSLDFDGKTWLREYRWFLPRVGYWDEVKIGLASPPIKTKKGWILFYHGIDRNRVYRVGAILLDLQNPLKPLRRSYEPLLEPLEEYEKVGIVPNVVFPCGAVVIKDKVFLYYGGADKVVCVATMNVNDLLKTLFV